MDHRITLSAAVLALVAGCSSSGPNDCGAFENCSGTGGSGTSGLILIDRDNAVDVIREAWYAATVSADIPVFVLGTGIGDTSGGVVIAPGNAAKIAARPSIFVDPFGPTTYNCPTSGTFIATGDVTDPNTITPGDTITYEASACDSGTGYVVEGTHRIDIASIDGDVASGQYQQGQTLTFTDFEAATPTVTTTLEGDHSAIIDARSAGSITTTVSGNSLRIGEQGISVLILDYNGATTVDTGSPFDANFALFGRASSTQITGAFDYFTEEPFAKPFGQPPTDGILDVFGDGGSIVRLAIIDPTLVRIQLDANGSGNFELALSISWAEFLSGNLVLNWSDTGLN
jgi:hypothetical protein